MLKFSCKSLGRVKGFLIVCYSLITRVYEQLSTFAYMPMHITLCDVCNADAVCNCETKPILTYFFLYFYAIFLGWPYSAGFSLSILGSLWYPLPYVHIDVTINLVAKRLELLTWLDYAKFNSSVFNRVVRWHKSHDVKSVYRYHIISNSLSSIYQRLLKLIEIWRSSDRKSLHSGWNWNRADDNGVEKSASG